MEQARTVAADFLAAWSAGDYAEAAALTDDPAGTETLLADAAGWVGVPGPDAVLDDIEPTGTQQDAATALAGLTWSPPAAPEWAYPLPMTLTRGEPDGPWRITSGASLVHPELAAGQSILVSRTLPPRASILDADGRPLFAETPVVTVGVDPGLVTDLPSLAATLADVLDVDAAAITADVQATPAGQFVPVITLRRSEYDAVRDQVYDLPGTVFQEATRQLAPSSLFARAVLGRVGPVTEEIVAESEGLLQPGDEGGLSGLQRAYQAQLSGTPGVTVSTALDGVAVTTLQETSGTPGTPVRTTLSTAVQDAADAAVATVTQPSFIVAVRPSTGEVLAVASNTAATPGNALTGQYPAGSTFKIVTAAAALQAGLVSPQTVLPCPATNNVDGREFENADRFVLGDVPFTTAFARSCNSTFTALGAQLDPTALTEAAAQFGIGSQWDLPVDVVTGSVATPDSAVRQAEDSIGQGDVLVSPFAVAMMAATVVAGAPPVPVLVTDADPAGQAPVGPPADVVEALRGLTRAVVTDGTATPLADLPGQVAGKTGTAEFGSGDPPPAHAWFAGYRGDLAFAVLVEGGQSSTTTAVPMADAFLSALPL
ncbi:MAG: penicillin-binding protein [Geodermatophilaceae bacterium]|nr:penicillin-binding protein [Geodermatophilaceae bacterium]